MPFNFVGSPAGPLDLAAQPSQPTLYAIRGRTLDAAGAPLGGCTVRAFETVTGILRAEAVSDADGYYTVGVSGAEGLTFFLVMYRAGAPDVTAATVNTLTPAPA
jgi:hypothetical protein